MKKIFKEILTFFKYEHKNYFKYATEIYLFYDNNFILTKIFAVIKNVNDDNRIEIHSFLVFIKENETIEISPAGTRWNLTYDEFINRLNKYKQDGKYLIHKFDLDE